MHARQTLHQLSHISSSSHGNFNLKAMTSQACVPGGEDLGQCTSMPGDGDLPVGEKHTRRERCLIVQGTSRVLRHQPDARKNMRGIVLVSFLMVMTKY